MEYGTIFPNEVKVFTTAEAKAPYFDWHNMEESIKTFKHFCQEGGFHYYARPKEEFSEREARTEAARLGFLKVIVEDLS